MKQLHLLHIGLPKSGTTWLWHKIKYNIDSTLDKEIHFFNTELDVKMYYDLYSMYNISANFPTNFFTIDQFLIKQLSLISKNIKCSISLRSPMSFACSYYNFIKFDKGVDEFSTYFFDTQLYDYYSYIIRWKKFFPDLHILFFDDLINNPKLYYKDYCNFTGLVYNNKQDFTKKINAQKNYNTSITFNKEQTNIINCSTKKLENLIERELSSWII